MALIRIGPFLDPEIDLPRTIQLEIPDEGELLPFLPSLIGLDLSDVSFGLEYGLGSHRWVQIRWVFLGSPLFFCLFYVGIRAEWVFSLFNSDLTTERYITEDNLNPGIFVTPDEMMSSVLRAYGVSSNLAITPEVRRCHPDVFREISLQLNGEIHG